MHSARLITLLLLAATGQAQVVVDRMVAVVNRRVIMESELDQSARVELLLQGQPPPGPNLAPAKTSFMLEQLIDRSLLEQQILPADLQDPSPAELAQRLQAVRARVPGADTEDGWKSQLAAYGVTQQDVEEHLISEYRVLHFVDLRFQSAVHVDKAAIAAYYQDKLVPELQKRGAPEPPLADVSDKIEKILLEQQVGVMLNEWLQTLRTQAHIEKIEALTPPTPGTKP
jgi:hypothetical protein